jgi:hypothetical protein
LHNYNVSGSGVIGNGGVIGGIGVIGSAFALIRRDACFIVVVKLMLIKYLVKHIVFFEEQKTNKAEKWFNSKVNQKFSQGLSFSQTPKILIITELSNENFDSDNGLLSGTHVKASSHKMTLKHLTMCVSFLIF